MGISTIGVAGAESNQENSGIVARAETNLVSLVPANLKYDDSGLVVIKGVP